MVDISFTDSEPLCDRGLRFFPLERQDFRDFIVSELGRPVFFAAAVCAMEQPIGLVFCWRRPTQVLRRNASTVTAAMRRLIILSWRVSVDAGTNISMSNNRPTIYPDLAISFVGFAKWPKKASFMIGSYGGLYKHTRLPHDCRSTA